jgi:hypothetical protein
LVYCKKSENEKKKSNKKSSNININKIKKQQEKTNLKKKICSRKAYSIKLNSKINNIAIVRSLILTQNSNTTFIILKDLLLWQQHM